MSGRGGPGVEMLETDKEEGLLSQLRHWQSHGLPEDAECDF